MFSFVFPMDTNRLEQFRKTKLAYDTMPQIKEFVIMTREKKKVGAFLKENDLMKDVRLIPYEVESGFNPSKAFNIGVREAKYDRIIITSPEVRPITNVLEQFELLPNENILAQVDDENERGETSCLISTSFRGDSPAMYFLAVFNKSDIKSINGWDEDFMKGYAYEDNDFGDRWKRAGIPFSVNDAIKAVHQYHPRSETISGGANTNFQLYQDNNAKGITYCKNGLIKYN